MAPAFSEDEHKGIKAFMRASDLWSLGFPHHSCICRREPGAPFPGLGPPAVPPSSYVYSAHFHRPQTPRFQLNCILPLDLQTLRCQARPFFNSWFLCVYKDLTKRQTESPDRNAFILAKQHTSVTPSPNSNGMPANSSFPTQLQPRRFAAISLPPCP